jgi:hypothetical protein
MSAAVFWIILRVIGYSINNKRDNSNNARIEEDKNYVGIRLQQNGH